MFGYYRTFNVFYFVVIGFLTGLIAHLYGVQFNRHNPLHEFFLPGTNPLVAALISSLVGFVVGIQLNMSILYENLITWLANRA